MVNSSIGLLTYDEAVYAGGYFHQSNSSNYYLNNGSKNFWTMSPAAFESRAYAYIVEGSSSGMINNYHVNYGTCICLRPVINLKSDVQAAGVGTANDPYVIFID